MTTDAAERERALDTAASFIVRAPAGSGKTGLLTQRILALLATVDEPEQIVAMTFTRKAAAEMKRRVMAALTEATAAAPENAYAARTHALAQAARQRDLERRWSLTENPARLRIQTIDSLAQSLARRLPITSSLGSALSVTERAEALYAEAARMTLAAVESIDAADTAAADTAAADAAALLRHLDNDAGRAQALLTGMLARRDQWLRHVFQLDRPQLEAALTGAVERALEGFCARLTREQRAELVALSHYAAGNAGELQALSALPDTRSAALPAWRALAQLLLVKKHDRFRKSFGTASGFPAEARSANPSYRQRIGTLTRTLAAVPGLAESLHWIRLLPEPRYSDSQWQTLGAFTRLLVRAAAELKLVFGEHGTVDFAEVTIAASRALGAAAAPSDLALALDYRLQHLLVDEFQDTSISQLELIEKLTAGWVAGDGRTLFVVGDPMQSVYRFREAEVALFLRAWEGAGPVPLQRLQLRTNFRSRPGLIAWVNRSFAQILPSASDLEVGAVGFEPAVAAVETDEAGGVFVHVAGNPVLEAEKLVELVQALRARDPDASIAILFRMRSDLADIVPALRRAALPYTAVELDALDSRPVVRDLLALTRALTHLGDRVAWLALLRAPWCGLTLSDLSSLIECENGSVSVWSLIADADAASLARLSADGQIAVLRLRDVMQRALLLDGRAGLRARVEHAWWLLGGPVCAADPAALADAERYFERLASLEAVTDTPDIAQLERSLHDLYAAADSAADPKLVMMTIHKAKGLEFDHVIVPATARCPRAHQADLLRWLERTDGAGSELLVTPINATGDSDSDPLYRWIQRLCDVRQAHEADRLLYVAATRARRELHWIACVQDTDDPPERGSFLHRLAPVLPEELAAAITQDAAGRTPGRTYAPAFDQSLRRLPTGWSMPVLPSSVSWMPPDEVGNALAVVEFSWAGEVARRVGVVVHRWLQTMADDGLQGWDAERIQGIVPLITRELAARGFVGSVLQAGVQRAAVALVNALSDPRALWLLGPRADARSEWQLTVHGADGLRRIVIDRAFRDAEGRQWIIDYKTGAHEGADVEAFLDREQLRYSGQLEQYARALGGEAQLAIYFPMLSGWREWASSDPSDARGELQEGGHPPLAS